MPAITVEVKPKKSKNKASPLNDGMDSENTDSASETEGSGNESETESTLTDSSQEDVPSQHLHQSARGGKKVPRTHHFVQRRTSEEALELVIIAAEALNKIVPLEVALHDHTYARPPNSLVNNVDLQGTSGLSLIAAAAAVVSPTLSRNAGSGKLPVLSPVRAPRGRPPNSQKRGSSSSSSKLAPTLLSPAGSCTSVLLTDVKTPTLRGRTRSAPTDRPRSSTFQFPRTSTLARISMTSGNRSVGSALRGIMPPASHMRQKDLTSGTSLKSMIASQPQPASGGSNTRFEALVNVAVAASPAELPETPANTPTPSTITFPSLPLQTSSTLAPNISSNSTPTTPHSCTPSKDGGTSTAILDVNQAINILAWASLAGQQAPSSGTTQLSTQPLFAQAPMLQASNLLGGLVGQSNSVAVVQDTNETDTSPSSQVAPTLVSSAPTVDTLLGQLAAASSSSVASRAEMPTTAGANSSEGHSSLTSSLTQQSPAQPLSLSHPAGTEHSASSSSQVRTTGSGDDLSNLNLLSSLVAVLSGSHPTSSSDSSSAPVTFTGGGNMHTAPATLAAGAAGFRPRKSNLEPVTTSASSLRVQDKTIPTRSQISTSLSSEQLSEGTTVSFSEGTRVDRTTNEEAMGVSELPKPSHKNDSHKGPLRLSPEHPGEELPTSVVRTSMTALAQGSSPKSQHHGFDTPSTLNMVRPTTTHMHNSTNDITASLASIIPNPLSYPSISQQSTLLLYTRSLSFPLSASSEPSPEDEEEDHLESATRGISELSKLLGTDNGTDTVSSKSRESSRYKGISPWNPNDSLTHPSSLPLSSRTSYSGSTSIANNPSSFHKTDFGAETSSKSFLSNLLESRGAVHRTPSPSRLGNTNNNSNTNSNSPLVNHDNST